MNPILRAYNSHAPCLALYEAPAETHHAAYWRINGYRATILIWTNEEWNRLKERPADAQYYACGVWCALRMD